MTDNSQRQSARFCITFVLLVFGTALAVYVNYRFVDPRLVHEPYKLSAYEYRRKKSFLLEKTDPLCQDLLKEAYCRAYYDCIMTNDFPLSPYKTDVALPNLQVHGEVYMLRESAELRYHLWRQAPPDVVLLGSSWMFQSFNRRCFIDRHPERRLLDFAIGANTPETTKIFLQELAIRGCEVPPGALFLYGINLVELNPSYEGCRPGFIKDALALTPNPLARELHLLHLGVNDLREKTSANLSALLSPKKEIDNRFTFEVSDEFINDPEALKADLCRLEPPRSIPKGIITVPFDKKRLDSLRWIAQWVKDHQGTLVLIKMPCSTLAQNYSVEPAQSFDLQIGDVVKDLGISYLDLSVHETVGINDTHFVSAAKRFNPTHLNYQGAVILTSYLLNRLDDAWLSQPPSKHADPRPKGGN